MKPVISYADMPYYEHMNIDDNFRCLDCRVHTGELCEYYMVVKEVWETAHPDHWGMLCIGCIEQRLGRELLPADFTDAPVNHIDSFDKSDRLLNRLGFDDTSHQAENA